MNILLSNDDGWRAEGLRALARGLEGLGAIVVVAPDRNRSGASNSLTLDGPLRVVEREDEWYAINGTPTDCVHLAVSGLLAAEFQLLVSGINHGANLGDDVLYSGTVAAAMEGRFLGLPSLAVSLVGEGRHFETAATVARRLVEKLIATPPPTATLYNINVPDVPLSALKGIVATRLGVRHRAQPIVRASDPRGRPVYWVGAPGEGQDAGPGTDFHAVESGYASVTPLQIDLTRRDALASVGDWLRDLDV